MRELPQAEGCVGFKYCGGGWGGYALYLFSARAERDAFVESANCNRAIEPYITIRERFFLYGAPYEISLSCISLTTLWNLLTDNF
jgi:hypothetical protein